MVTTGLQNNNIRRFSLVLCEILNQNLHGNDDNIDGHYLIINKFDASTGSAIYSDSGSDSDLEEDDSDSDSSESSLSFFTSDYNEYYHQEISPNVKHSIIRNYQNIIARSDYIRPEIAECIVLPSQHTVAIIKTIWIKIIQRKWKKIYAERMIIIRRRLQINTLYMREVTGKWPQNCAYLPSIYRLMWH